MFSARQGNCSHVKDAGSKMGVGLQTCPCVPAVPSPVTAIQSGFPVMGNVLWRPTRWATGCPRGNITTFISDFLVNDQNKGEGGKACVVRIASLFKHKTCIRSHREIGGNVPLAVPLGSVTNVGEAVTTFIDPLGLHVFCTDSYFYCFLF